PRPPAPALPARTPDNSKKHPTPPLATESPAAPTPRVMLVLVKQTFYQSESSMPCGGRRQGLAGGSGGDSDGGGGHTGCRGQLLHGDGLGVPASGRSVERGDGLRHPAHGAADQAG